MLSTSLSPGACADEFDDDEADEDEDEDDIDEPAATANAVCSS